MNKFLIFISILILFATNSTVFAQNIKINEIHFSDISENYPEFIELINQSEEPVSLLGYTISINNDADSLIAVNDQYIIEPGSYALVVSRADTNQGFFSTTGGIPVLLADDRDFNLFRNIDNELMLYNEYHKSVDSLKISTTPKPDHSIEYNSVNGQWENSKIKYGTPGKKNSALLESIDLEITSFQIAENHLSPDFHINIKNNGHKNSTGATLNIGHDSNHNDSLETEEILATSSIDIAAMDSISQTITIPFDTPGMYQMIATVIDEEDQNTGNNTASLLFNISYPKSTLLINEFMYAPDDSEEWIELYNNSPEEINLKYWQISDMGNAKMITEADHMLPADSYIVISTDSVFLDNWTEDVNFLFAEIGLPSLNNTGDSIKILDPGANIIDSLYYTKSWGYEKGVSLEKIDPEAFSNNEDHWGLSVHEAGGTPGFVNSIILKDFDLTILPEMTGLNATKIFPQDTVDFIVTVKNTGRKAASPFQINLFHSIGDTLFDSTLVSHTMDSLGKGQWVQDTFAVPFNQSGINYLRTEIEYDADENQSNNVYTLPVVVGFPAKTAVINEIMYNPETGKPEWFEIANISGDTINAQNWLFRDSQNTVHIATEDPTPIPPDSFAVITSANNFADYYENFRGILLQSPSFPTLNNDGDSLILLDPVENYIDSLEYTSEWGNEKGVSLERKSTEQNSNSFLNWGLSQEEPGSTPGFTNSLALKDYDLAIDTVYLKKETVLHHEDAVLVIRIENNGAKTIHNFDLSINLWDDVNREVVISEKYISVNKTISAGYYTRYEVELAGIPGGVHPVTARVYALKDNIIENNTFTTNLKIGYSKSSIVVNELMYAPHSGEAEWIELLNTGNQPVNLHGWLFKDISGKQLPLCDTVQYLQPEAYIVFSNNEEIHETFPDIASDVLYPESFPTLNNTSDAVVIFDAVGHEIDSVYYIKSWGGNTGLSIERRNPFVPAVSRDNWGSTLDSIGGTPGSRNTILKYDHDLAAVPDGFNFMTPETTPFTENEFTLAVINNGIYDSGPFSVKLYHDKNFDNYGEEEEMIWSLHNIPSLAPDSIKVVAGKIYSENSGRAHYIAKISENSEENVIDNQITTVLKVEFDEDALVFNEFLAAPESGETEFLECINNTDFDVILQGWELSNEWHSATIDFDTKIPSGQYVVFCADSSFFDIYPPTNSPVFVLEDWAGMNNTRDQIVLKDLTGKLIDSLQYDENWEIEYGKSLEKIMPSWASEDSASWKLCEAEPGATPGEFNSISPYVYDLQISDLWISGTQGDSETLFDIKFYLENIGRENCENAEIKIYDVKFNSKSLFRTLKIGEMEANTQDSVSMQLANLDKGYHKFLARISWEKDQNMENDTAYFEIDISFELNDMYISEFMAHPKSVKTKGASIAEYIEIYNPQNRLVHIDNWYITDENTADLFHVFSKKSIPAESYFVIASDSTIFNFPDANKNNTAVLEKLPSLNNDKDKILLMDPTGVVTDSVVYTSDWEIEQGTSKEKVYMTNENFLSNWRNSTSPQGGTPGAVNSVVVAKTEKKTGLRTAPNPFTPNGDGEKDEVGFYYQLSYPSANIRIDIYDLTGRLIASPVENMRTAAEGVVYWDGTNKYGEMARVGMYIARITATDANSKKSEGHIATFTLMK